MDTATWILLLVALTLGFQLVTIILFLSLIWLGYEIINKLAHLARERAE